MLPRAHPHPFPATRRLTLAVVGCLVLHLVLAWLALGAAFVFVELVWRALAGKADYRPLLAAHLGQLAVLRTAQGVLWAGTAVVFLRWVGRAHGNLLALGATGLRYAPRDAMRTLLLPGAMLLRPLRELWNASDPRLPAGGAWSAQRMPARVAWWWAGLLAALALEAASRVLALASGRALDLGPAMLALVLGQVATIITAVLGIAVVLGIDARQEEAAWRRG